MISVSHYTHADKISSQKLGISINFRGGAGLLAISVYLQHYITDKIQINVINYSVIYLSNNSTNHRT